MRIAGCSGLVAGRLACASMCIPMCIQLHERRTGAAIAAENATRLSLLCRPFCVAGAARRAWAVSGPELDNDRSTGPPGWVEPEPWCTPTIEPNLMLRLT